MFMISSRYAFERGGPRRLQILRSPLFNEMIVRIDGIELARLDRQQMTNGAELRLADHSLLRIHLIVTSRAKSLYLTRDGTPLPNSEGDAAKTLFTALLIVFGMAALQIALGVAITMKYWTPQHQVPDWNLGAGGVLFLLGILAARHSTGAMVAASIMTTMDLALAFGTDRHNVNIVRLIFGCGIFIFLLWRGINAAHDLQLEDARAAAARHAHRSG